VPIIPGKRPVLLTPWPELRKVVSLLSEGWGVAMRRVYRGVLLGLGLSIAVQAAVQVAAQAAPAAYNWTGFYIGGNVGAGWGTVRTDTTRLRQTAGAFCCAHDNRRMESLRRAKRTRAAFA
jgi:hypothetical protein